VLCAAYGCAVAAHCCCRCVTAAAAAAAAATAGVRCLGVLWEPPPAAAHRQRHIPIAHEMMQNVWTVTLPWKTAGCDVWKCTAECILDQAAVQHRNAA
jgi:hypothetical protein